MTFAGMNEEISMITQDIFSALIDREPGMLLDWYDEKPEITDPLYSWVDMDGVDAARALLVTERETANDLARALLYMDADDPVADEDLVDAFGEVANVVGGNLKSLLPEPGTLSIPKVNAEPPSEAGATLIGEVLLSWKGKILIISTWALSPTSGSADNAVQAPNAGGN